MTGHEWWIGPLEHEDPRLRPPGDCACDCADALSEVGDQAATPVCDTGCVRHGVDGDEDVVEAHGVERDHRSPAPQMLERSIDIARWQRAHPAQILGEHEVGVDTPEGLDVEAVHGLARRREAADEFVDLGCGLALDIEPVDEDRTSVTHAVWFVALEGDADEIVEEPECPDDLGGSGQKRDDAHGCHRASSDAGAANAGSAGPVAAGGQNVMTRRPRVPPASRRRCASGACSGG